MNQNFAKILIATGALFLAVGLVYYYFGHRLFPPGGGGPLAWLGKLPGDINYQNGNTRVFFPITTCIVFTLIINLLVWVVKRFF